MKWTSPLCLLVIAFFSVSSCQQTTPADNENEETPAEKIDQLKETADISNVPKTEASTVNVTDFNEFPDEIDGCACYYARDKSTLQAGNYVYMTNYDKLGFMFLDGEMRKFRLINSEDMEDQKLKETWTNETYSLVITTSQTGRMDETWQNTGTISITPKGKKSITISILGECGC